MFFYLVAQVRPWAQTLAALPAAEDLQAPTPSAVPFDLSGHPYSADSVLSPYVYVFYLAFIISFIFTPVMRVVATYYGIIDKPDRVRKMHSVPVAYLGGVAVFLGWIAGMALGQLVPLHRVEPGLPGHLVVNFSIIVGSSLIVILGLWDDIKGVRPSVKILAQVFAAGCLLYKGIGAECTKPFFEFLDSRLHHFLGWDHGTPMVIVRLTSAMLVIFVVVGCCNATNLMDGLDGLCGGVTAVIAAGFLFLAVHLAMFAGAFDANTDALRVVMALALLGAVLGFVPFNFNPASIFMGDTGSMFLGFSCATMILLAAQGQHPKWFLASMVMFALPVLDTALAFARRWVNGRPIFSADRHHFHHQLVARGYTVKQTVIISYALALFFAVCGAAIVYMRTRYAMAFYLVIFGFIIVAAYKMGMVHEKPQVITRRPLTGPESAVSSKMIEAGSVIEIREERSSGLGMSQVMNPADHTPGGVPLNGGASWEAPPA